jgi:hypothetical protein
MVISNLFGPTDHGAIKQFPSRLSVLHHATVREVECYRNEQCS